MAKLKSSLKKLSPKRLINIIVLTIKDAYAKLSLLFNKRKGKKMGNKKQSKNNTDKPSKQKLNGIIGLLQLLVVISVAYSSYVVWFGTTGLAEKIMLVPQMTYAAVVLIRKFNSN